MKVFVLLYLLINLFLIAQSFPIGDYKQAIEYLSNFEYLTSDEKLSLNSITDKQIEHNKQFKRALRHLQRNGNIPITGEIDKETIALMHKPRCGVGDKILNVKRHKRYTLMSSKWPKTDLTWRYKPKLSDQFVDDEKNIRRIIGEALSVWQQDTIMTFKEDRYGDDADILISFEAPYHTDLDMYKFGPSTLAHAFQPSKGLGGDAHFNREINWDFGVSFDSEPQKGKISFYAVALHELGHSLGLAHSRDNNAVMYEFYSDATSKLSQDDIRGMQHIYGIPPHKKYTGPPMKPEDKDEMPIWDIQPAKPNTCNTSYDAIAMIDKELLIFRRQYMFGPAVKEPVEIRKHWKELPEKLTHVDAVYQTMDGRVLFFIDTHVYVFVDDKLKEQTTLQNMGLSQNVKKIDAIFRYNFNKRTYIFTDNTNYWTLDEKTLRVEKKEPIRISSRFRDINEIETGFTYKDGKLYFFKFEHFYEFDDKTARMKVMKPGISGNLFMNCGLPEIDFESRFGEETDFIDLGEVEEDEFVAEDEKSGRDDANSIKSVALVLCVVMLTHFTM